MPSAAVPAALRGGPTAPVEAYWTALRLFSAYRIALAALLLGLTLAYGDALSLGAHRLDLFRGAAAAYLVLAAMAHSVLARLRVQFVAQLSLHVALDVVALTVLMYASGGLRSGLGAMVLVSLIGAALLAPLRVALAYAAFATLALLFEQAVWVLYFDAPGASFMQPGMLAIGCFASAGVTGWLVQRAGASERLARERERELALQLRVSQLVIDDMPHGVLVLDAAGRVRQHNPGAQRLFGAEALRGADLAQIAPAAAACWRRWRAGSGAERTEIELRGRGLRLRMIEAGAGEDLTVMFVEDTTRALEEARQLKLAALGRLTANLAHEIRNPLSAISHAAELLGESPAERERERLCRIIADNTRRLERLVADVLQLNRRDRTRSEPIELAAWLGQFVEEFAMSEGVPREWIAVDVARAVRVEFDREHLRQVLWNLLRNAVRHARPARGCVRLVLGAFAGQVELNVLDNGPGVPRERLAQLFEPFFTTDRAGTGLGLYIARELCAANRATLEYVPGGEGAHFRLVCAEAPA
ncbi:MAG: PAS domain-containing sensor histidine kinase [Burkholderiales bacterium]|nr:PAS domain-containing sensor histidine kinase [Burkholderiales bacterium]